MSAEEYSQRSGDQGAIRAAPVPPGWDTAVDIDQPPATVPDPADVEVPEALRAQIEAIIARYPDRHSAALPRCAPLRRRTAGARRWPSTRWPP